MFLWLILAHWRWVKQDLITTISLLPAGLADPTVFKLRLQIEGKPYATSLEQKLNVSGSSTKGAGLNPLVIGGIVIGVLLIAGAGVLLWKRKRI